MSNNISNIVRPPSPITDPPPIIQPGPPPTLLYVNVLSPNGGEVFQPGQSVTIHWSSTGADQHVVKFASDGATFNDISSQLPGSAQSFAWTVPQQLTTAGRIRVAVRDAAGNRVSDDSDGLFTIGAVQPVITSIAPTNGSVGGGTLVTIFGANFTPDCRAKFGGTDAVQTTYINTGQLQATTPAAAAPGPVNVRVVNAAQAFGVLQNAFTYTVAAAPSVTSANPNMGPVAGGTQVTINGQNFMPGCVAKFGGMDARQTTYVNSTQVMAVTPTASGPGAVNVRVVNPDGQGGGLPGAFTYVAAPALVITGINPTSGPASGGNTVTISGNGFMPGIRVAFGGQQVMQVNFISSTQLAVGVPAHAPGAVDVTITNPDGSVATLRNAYTYVPAPAPSVTSANPNMGPVAGGTPVTINGQNFMPGCVAKFGGMDARQTTYVNSTQVMAVTPTASGPGAVNVRVVNPDGQGGGLPNAFTYVMPAAPSVTSANPNMGPVAGGTQVTINGQNFMPNCVAKFGGMDARQTTYVNSTQVMAVTPTASGPGAVNVRVVNPDGQGGGLPNAFTYVMPAAPSVTSANPNMGPVAGGTQVTINGQNFMPNCVAKFGGMDARQTTYVNSTQVMAVTPTASGPGAVNVRVVNPDGQGGGLPNAFTYISVAPAPTIASFDPTSGSIRGGAQVTINGQNFVDGCTVMFGNQNAQRIFIGKTKVQAIAPPVMAPTTVQITLINPDGQVAVAPGTFAYVNSSAPTITSLMPTSGSVAGGTEVTINGENFMQNCLASFAGIGAATTFKSMTQITAITPPMPTPGTVTVIVQNPDGQAAVAQNAFTFVAASSLAITSLTPPNGPDSGGTTVTINGTGFAEGVRVLIGGSVPLNTIYVSSSTLRVVTPPHAAGSVDVTVTNPNGQQVVLRNGFTYESALVMAEIIAVRLIDPDPDDAIAALGADLGSGSIPAGNKVEFDVVYRGGFGFYTVVPDVANRPAGTMQMFSDPMPARDVPFTITITTSADQTPVGTYMLSVGGTIKQSGVPDRPVPNPGTYTLTITPAIRRVKVLLDRSSQTLAAGASVDIPITLKRKNYDNRPVTFQSSRLPDGATSTFTPPTTLGNSATLTLSLASTATQGNASPHFGIRDEIDLNKIVDAVLQLTVQPPATGTLKLVVAKPNANVEPGSSAFFNITLSDRTTSEVIKLDIDRAKSSLASGTQIVGFTEPSISGPDSSQLEVKVDRTTTADSMLVLTGTRADGSMLVSVPLKVHLLPSVRVVLTPKEQTANPGDAVDLTATIYRPDPSVSASLTIRTSNGVIPVQTIAIPPSASNETIENVTINIPKDARDQRLQVTATVVSTSPNIMSSDNDDAFIQIVKNDFITLTPTSDMITVQEGGTTSVTLLIVGNSNQDALQLTAPTDANVGVTFTENDATVINVDGSTITVNVDITGLHATPTPVPITITGLDMTNGNTRVQSATVNVKVDPKPKAFEGKRFKEGKEGKELKELKEGKEGKELKERKEGLEHIGPGGAGNGRGDGAPLASDLAGAANAEGLYEQGHAFIGIDQRPPVGDSIMRAEGN
ncbi:MAG TPA: IPT/TIG domain-containing protein [Candidatus Kapabacteria bacterium]|nr:IPT/TIG domain-containing protein [Candidatus Kapabacteria bacterium]